MEVELKLKLPGFNIRNDLITFLETQGYRIYPAGSVINSDLYLETFGWQLGKKGYALRVRDIGSRRFITLKNTGIMENGIVSRQEIEMEITYSDTAYPENFLPEIDQIINPIIFPAKLIPFIRIMTQREKYRMESDTGDDWELTFDASEFCAQGVYHSRNTRKWYEMEIEIRQGDVERLRSIEQLIRSHFHLKYSARSKLDAAIRCLKLKPVPKTPSLTQRVNKNDTCSQAIRKILVFHEHRIRICMPGILWDADPEFVHQARVSIRRMRVALRLFGAESVDKSIQFLCDSLRWIGQNLNNLRDLDVFLLRLPVAKDTIPSWSVFYENKIRMWLHDRRKIAIQSIDEMMKSDRYLQFIRTITDMLNPANSYGSLTSVSVKELIPDAILKITLEIVKRTYNATRSNQWNDFHALRISFKKLRYTCEIVSHDYPVGLSKYIQQSIKIQDCLGILQDAVLSKELIAEFADDLRCHTEWTQGSAAVHEEWNALLDRMAMAQLHGFFSIRNKINLDLLVQKLSRIEDLG